MSFTDILSIGFVAPQGLNVDVDPVSGETLFTWESPEHNVQEYDVYLDDLTAPVAAGITSQEYVFEDLGSGFHTAGVRAVYTTGQSEISEFMFIITGIEQASKHDVTVYPNPATDRLTIAGAMGSAVTLHDLSGRLRASFRSTGEVFEFDLAGLENGVYVLKIMQDDEVVIRKIEKEK